MTAPAHLDLTGPVPLVVVDAPDWLDLSTAADVEQVLRQALAGRPPLLAVDLSRTVMADAYGVGMLDRVRVEAARRGTELVLVGANAGVRRVLALLRLQQVLPVRPREEVTPPGVAGP